MFKCECEFACLRVSVCVCVCMCVCVCVCAFLTRVCIYLRTCSLCRNKTFRRACKILTSAKK